MEREKIDMRALTERLQSTGVEPSKIKRWLSVHDKSQCVILFVWDAVPFYITVILSGCMLIVKLLVHFVFVDVYLRIRTLR